MKKIFILFAAIGLVAFSSCTGDEGPQGPPGENALIPQAFTIRNVNLVRITANNYEFTREFSQYIDGDLFDDETVLIYRQTDVTNSGAPVWQLLPKTTNFDNGDVADYFYDFSKEDFIISVIASFDLATEPSLINNQNFRVVISPSNLINTVNKNNYLEVMKAVNLKESQVKDIKL